MKKLTIIILCLIGISFTSCDKFLELTPRNKKIVRSVEDYRDIMASYMLFLKTPNRAQMSVFGAGSYCTPLFSHNITLNLGIYTGETSLSLKHPRFYDSSTGEYTLRGKNMMTWLNTDPLPWERYYDFLGPINLIISGIQTAEGNNENLRNYVLGEALVWRAFAYFKLLQYYAPYKENKYGVPVYLKPYEDVGNAMPKRGTQTEVFAQILGDCNKALQLLETTASNEWNTAWRDDFIYAMMASIYTWKAGSGAAEPADWKNAEEYAVKAMRGRVLSNSAADLKKMFDCSNVTITTSLESSEFYFRIMDGDNKQTGDFFEAYYAYLGGPVDGLANPFYYNKFNTGDIRKTAYFKDQYSDKYSMYGKGSLVNGVAILPFRLAEMYLIKAEALARQGKTAEAKTAFEDFVAKRYTANVPVPAADAQQLLAQIMDERLREFYMENDFRWLDMKRQGITIQRVINGERFTLLSDDFRYSFPIPRREMDLNKNMEQTPGWEKIIL